MLTLRPYQKEAADAVIRRLAVFRDSGTLLDLPTGTGKTIVFCAIAQRWHRATGSRILILAHRKNLVYQTGEKLYKGGFFQNWQIGLEHGREESIGIQPIVLSVDQTMMRRLENFKRDDFGLIVIDEAHRVRTPTYEKILTYFKASRLGVTATPKRLDEKSLGSVFDSFAYRYKLADAIHDGWLVPIKTKRIELRTLKFNGVGVRGGDYKKEKLSRILRKPETVDEIVDRILLHSGQRPTLVFTVDTKHTEPVLERINSLRPDSARRSDSKMSDVENEKALQDFKAGVFQYLINCEMYTEGTDLPNVACVAMARPTQSWAKYMQMLGRGTRLLGLSYEESVVNGKPDVLVLDFTDNSVDHSPLSVSDVLYDDLESSDKEKTSNRERDDESEETPDVEEPVEDVTSTAKDIDIFNIDLSTNGHTRATKNQVLTLLSLGFAKTKAAKLTETQADRVIHILRHRKREGLASYKQARQLRRYGLDGNMPKAEAQKAIGMIAAAGWPAPYSQTFLNLGLLEPCQN